VGSSLFGIWGAGTKEEENLVRRDMKKKNCKTERIRSRKLTETSVPLKGGRGGGKGVGWSILLLYGTERSIFLGEKTLTPPDCF